MAADLIQRMIIHLDTSLKLNKFEKVKNYPETDPPEVKFKSNFKIVINFISRQPGSEI